MENPVVVETDDAVLMVDRSQAQNVKTIVKQLEADGSPKARPIARSTGPGVITPVCGRQPLAVSISVKPGASLSLQMHHHRAEHWIVVKGTALVERDGEQQLIGENQHLHPLGCRHRLTNPG